jgi:hypothetical protein
MMNEGAGFKFGGIHVEEGRIIAIKGNTFYRSYRVKQDVPYGNGTALLTGDTVYIAYTGDGLIRIELAGEEGGDVWFMPEDEKARYFELIE